MGKPPSKLVNPLQSLQPTTFNLLLKFQIKEGLCLACSADRGNILCSWNPFIRFGQF